jgi:hypothetical protein
MNTNSKEQAASKEGSRSASAEPRLRELGIKLPEPPEPFGTYVEGGTDRQSALSERNASYRRADGDSRWARRSGT